MVPKTGERSSKCRGVTIICTFMQIIQEPGISIGRVVRTRRRELNLRQADLAELAGCSTRFIHALEHDKPSLLLDKVADVLAVLGLRFDVVARSPGS
jgi:y4mF family transcriptional regulator